MGYAIMRFQKLKAASMGSLAGSLAHTLRSRYTPNADPELSKDNRTLLGPDSTVETVRAIRARWPDKHRHDAVGCIEYFIGASPEWFKKHGGEGDQERYFDLAIDWLKQHYGEENVISVVQHNDETSPHLAAYVVPRDPETGNLNAKRWTGGRGVCSAMQTSFHAAAGEPVGLDRGIKGSQAEHQTIARWYEEQANLDKRQASIDEDRQRIENEREAAAADRRAAEEKREDTMQMVAKARGQLAEWENELNDRDDAADLRDKQAAETRQALEERERELQDRAKEVDQRAEQVAQDRQALEKRERELQDRAKVVDQRAEEAAQASKRAEARVAHAAEAEARLGPLQRDLEARKDELDKKAQDLSATAGKLRTWEAKRDAWLKQHRPVSLSEVQELSLDLAALPDDERIKQMQTLHKSDRPMADAVDRLNWVTYDDGSVTPEGRRALVEHGSLADRDRVERTWQAADLEPPKGGSGPGL